MSDTYSSIVSAKTMPAGVGALRVEVIADLVCPFCFIGKRRLDEAMQAVHGPVEMSWYPYQLNPQMPDDGMTLTDYLTERFGTPRAVQPTLDHLKAEGSVHGITFDFARIERVPNTLAAHQLMHLADSRGIDQGVLADDLMSAFFEHGRDIGDRDVLIDIAAMHGLSEEAVIRVIEDRGIREAVLHREKQVRDSGIGGVPGFLLNRRLLVVGAQDTDSLINAFDRAMFGEGDEEVASPALH